MLYNQKGKYCLMSKFFRLTAIALGALAVMQTAALTQEEPVVCGLDNLTAVYNEANVPFVVLKDKQLDRFAAVIEIMLNVAKPDDVKGLIIPDVNAEGYNNEFTVPFNESLLVIGQSLDENDCNTGKAHFELSVAKKGLEASVTE